MKNLSETMNFKFMKEDKKLTFEKWQNLSGVAALCVAKWLLGNNFQWSVKLAKPEIVSITCFLVKHKKSAEKK